LVQAITGPRRGLQDRCCYLRVIPGWCTKIHIDSDPVPGCSLPHSPWPPDVASSFGQIPKTWSKNNSQRTLVVTHCVIRPPGKIYRPYELCNKSEEAPVPVPVPVSVVFGRESQWYFLQLSGPPVLNAIGTTTGRFVSLAPGALSESRSS
jgi:hypothetical protein